MIIKLYHGTTNRTLKKIMSEGLIDPYLTDSKELAKYYAECVTNANEIPIILSMDVEVNHLRYDIHSMEEPVGFGKITSNKLEEYVKETLEYEKEEHPDWLKDGIIEIPPEEYLVSLDTVAACWYEGTIDPKLIECIEP